LSGSYGEKPEALIPVWLDRKEGERLKSQKVNWVDLVTGMSALLVTVYVYVVTGGYPETHGNTMSAATFPRLLCTLMALAGLGLSYGAIKKGCAAEIRLRNPKKVFGLIALLIVYAFVIESAGFTLTTIVLMAAILFMFKIEKILYLVLLPIIATLIIQYIFQKILSVPLPTGIFTIM
jgi:putative tricarboxylic transport membrane protein